jgi:pro-kumamolisin-like protein
MVAGRFEIPGSIPARPAGEPSSPLLADQRLNATIVLQHHSQEDVDVVSAFARNASLEVTEADATKRTVKVSGTAAALAEAFNVDLRSSGNYVTYTGPVSVPEELAGKVMAVLGLDNRPIAHRG